MLKACFDCIIGRPESNNEDNANNVNLRRVGNGAQKSRKAIWPPKPNMFHLPKEISNGDSISISGQLQHNPNSFAVILAMDDIEVFKFHADFHSNRMTVITDNNGAQTDVEITEFETRELFSEGRYKFRMDIISEYQGNFVNIFVEDSPIILVKIDLQNLQDITHILLDGDYGKITNISFQFA